MRNELSEDTRSTRLKAISASLLIGGIVLSISCRGTQIVPSVTCEGLRGVRLGMDTQQVEARLGTPYAKSPRFKTNCSDEPNEIWEYHDYSFVDGLLFDSDRFVADFRDGKLVEVRSYRKPPDGIPQPRLFDLSYKPDANGQLQEKREEGKLFEATFCPNKAKTAKG